MEGEKVFGVVDDLHRKYIDVEVEVEFDRRPYAGEQSQDTKTFRVVGVRNEDADDYHLYITNLTREEFFPEDIATIYQSRWAVEPLFRELKTEYELDEFDTTKPHIVECVAEIELQSDVPDDLPDLESVLETLAADHGIDANDYLTQHRVTESTGPFASEFVEHSTQFDIDSSS